MPEEKKEPEPIFEKDKQIGRCFPVYSIAKMTKDEKEKIWELLRSHAKKTLPPGTYYELIQAFQILNEDLVDEWLWCWNYEPNLEQSELHPEKPIYLLDRGIFLKSRERIK